MTPRALRPPRLRRRNELVSFVRSEEGRRTPPAQGRARYDRRARGDAGSAGAQRRSVTRRAVKLPLYYIFARSRRETRTGAAVRCSRGETEQKIGGPCLPALIRRGKNPDGHRGTMMLSSRA